MASKKSRSRGFLIIPKHFYKEHEKTLRENLLQGEYGFFFDKDPIGNEKIMLHFHGVGEVTFSSTIRKNCIWEQNEEFINSLMKEKSLFYVFFRDYNPVNGTLTEEEYQILFKEEFGKLKVELIPTFQKSILPTDLNRIIYGFEEGITSPSLRDINLLTKKQLALLLTVKNSLSKEYGISFSDTGWTFMEHFASFVEWNVTLNGGICNFHLVDFVNAFGEDFKSYYEFTISH